MTFTIRAALILISIVFLTATGCKTLFPTVKSSADMTAQEKYERAQELKKDGELRQAVVALERLESAHPDFEKIPQVQLEVAQIWFDMEEYDRAISEFKRFINYNPTHEDAGKAKYMVALAYFNQIKPTDRDDTMVIRAAEEFKAVVDDPAAGDYRDEAREKLLECRRKLADKELYKARTYLTLGKDKAARIAAQRVLDVYPEVGREDEAKAIIKKSKGESGIIDRLTFGWFSKDKKKPEQAEKSRETDSTEQTDSTKQTDSTEQKEKGDTQGDSEAGEATDGTTKTE